MLASPFSARRGARALRARATPDHTASALAGELGLDPGYLSRHAARLFRAPPDRQERGARRSPPDDAVAHGARPQSLRAAREGSNAVVAGLLDALPVADQDRVVAAMGAVERLNRRAAAPNAARPAIRLRPPAPGDLGWVVARHGALYAQERGWGMRFEGLVAEIVAQFAADLRSAARALLDRRYRRRAGRPASSW